MLAQNKIGEDAKPVVDHQRRLNPKMKEVVRKRNTKASGGRYNLSRC